MDKDKYETEQNLRIELLKQEIELRKAETLRAQGVEDRTDRRFKEADAAADQRQERAFVTDERRFGAWQRHVVHVERVNRFHMTANVFQVIALFLIAWGIISR